MGDNNKNMDALDFGEEAETVPNAAPPPRQHRGPIRPSGPMGSSQGTHIGGQVSRKPQNTNSKTGLEAMQEKADTFAKGVKAQVTEDYHSEISSDMVQQSRFGFSFYLYAILAFGLMIVGGTTGLIMLAGWILLVEDNRTLTKMVLSTLVLCIAISVCGSVIVYVFNTLDTIIPSSIGNVRLSLITGPINFLEDIIDIVYDFGRIFIGVWGVLKAKNGNYFKIKLIEEQFK